MGGEVVSLDGAWRALTAEEKAVAVRLAIDELTSRGLQPTAHEIAEHLGAPSRNAIIGVCHRNLIRLPVDPGKKPPRAAAS